GDRGAAAGIARQRGVPAGLYSSPLMKVIVIIPAAGLGTRMAPLPKPGKKTGPSKQFAELGGVPILILTLRKFVAVDSVQEIYVALPRGEAERFRPRLEKEGLSGRVTLVEGGENRQQSVANALAKVKAASDDIVLVHDAVRPFVDGEIIRSVIAAAQKH